MSDRTAIEWTDASWNPVVGCSLVSPGCTNCYAMRLAGRLEKMGSPIYRGLTQSSKAGPVWTGKVEMSNWGQVIKPLSWRRPRRIFVNSMSDLFHENLHDDRVDKVFAVMALAKQHVFQILTKRPERMQRYLSSPDLPAALDRAMDAIAPAHWHDRELEDAGGLPLPNVWVGVSAEDQATADERIPLLLQTPAAKRFISAEPLLGPIDLRPHLIGHEEAGLVGNCVGWTPPLDWVICGGESGPGARPMHPDWARSLRDQCAAGGVTFFFKQWGEFIPQSQAPASLPLGDFKSVALRDDNLIVDGIYRVGKKRAGRLLDGREHSEFPR